MRGSDNDKILHKLVLGHIGEVLHLKKNMNMLKKYVSADFYRNMEKRLLAYQSLVNKGLKIIEKKSKQP